MEPFQQLRRRSNHFSGYVLQPEIALPDVSQINISRDGIISVLVAGGVGAEAVGQLQIADFTNRAGFSPR